MTKETHHGPALHPQPSADAEATPPLLRILTTPITAETTLKALNTPITREDAMRLLNRPIRLDETRRILTTPIELRSTQLPQDEASTLDLRAEVRFDFRYLPGGPNELVHTPQGDEPARDLLARALLSATRHHFSRMQAQLLDVNFAGERGVMAVRISQPPFAYMCWLPLNLPAENYPTEFGEAQHSCLILDLPDAVRNALPQAAQKLREGSLWNTPTRLLITPHGAQLAPLNHA